MQLTDLGWNSFFEDSFRKYDDNNAVPMRIVRENKEKYIASNGTENYSCTVSGKFKYETKCKSDYPTVGDWVVTSLIPQEKKALIHAVLPRKSIFSRKAVGQIVEEQLVAVNIDTVFIVIGLDFNFDLRRIERYLVMVCESKARPVILLNKSDLCSTTELRKAEVALLAEGVDVHTLSLFSPQGLEALSKYITPGETIAFFGSSGVGKSSIINSLLKTDRLKVGDVSSYGSQGRHTTTFRELIVLPNGGMVIDTPGMREMQGWGDEAGLKQAFDDIDELSLLCRFNNCSHGSEPGCAVREAVKKSTLDSNRLDNYLRLKKERAQLPKIQSCKSSGTKKTSGKKISHSSKGPRKKQHMGDDPDA
jgi:ribosome biogenesis GTPase / thiamine phosphate phosphatase